METTQATTMPNWPELHERDPNLRPDDIVTNGGGRFRLEYGPAEPPMGNMAWLWVPVNTDGSHRFDGTGCIPCYGAIALCRDAAVRWLAKGERYLGFFEAKHLPGTPWSVVEMNYNYDDTDLVIYPESSAVFATPDEALFAAVKAVLDAR